MKNSARNLLLALTAATLITTYSAIAYGQQGGGPPPQEGHQGQHSRGPGTPGGHGAFGPEQRLERMSKDLNLTNDQQTKLKGVFENEKKQLDALRDDASVSGEDKRAKFDSIRNATQTEVRNTLTDAQKTKFDEMQTKMKERRQHGEGHGEHDGPPPTPSNNNV
jgi:Spy/CpxP family protein refolding chaperone